MDQLLGMKVLILLGSASQNPVSKMDALIPRRGCSGLGKAQRSGCKGKQ